RGPVLGELRTTHDNGSGRGGTVHASGDDRRRVRTGVQQLRRRQPLRRSEQLAERGRLDEARTLHARREQRAEQRGAPQGFARGPCSPATTSAVLASPRAHRTRTIASCSSDRWTGFLAFFFIGEVSAAWRVGPQQAGSTGRCSTGVVTRAGPVNERPARSTPA